MSDTTPRDQLAQIIYDTLNGQYGDFTIAGAVRGTGALTITPTLERTNR